MSIRELQKSVGILSEAFPEADQCLALSRAVGISLGMATNLGGLGDAMHDAMTRAELINLINNKQEVYQLISRCNDEVLLCVDTTVRQFTKTFVYRLEIARGNPAAFADSAVEAGTLQAVELLTPVFRGILSGK